MSKLPLSLVTVSTLALVAVLVALTGWGSAADKQRSKQAGFDLHLTKPVDVSAVRDLLVLSAGI